jgi:diaminopimelate decarboxylase
MKDTNDDTPYRPSVNYNQLFNSLGLHIDASSGYEIERAMRAGIPASHISLSSQVCIMCHLLSLYT